MSLSIEELSMVAEELPLAIWLGRVPSGEVVYTNRTFREVLGIEPPPGAGRGEFVEPYGVHKPDGTPYPEADMPFERAITARCTIVLDDLVIHRRDGRRVNLRVFAKPVFDANGTITHVLEAFTDITREVEADRARLEGERKLASAQRMESIGQLVMGISHDFNNLLTVTTLTTSRLLARETDADVRASLEDIETVTRSSIELVKKLLAFSRRSPQPLAPVDLGATVQSVVAISQRTFDRRITLVTEAAPETAWIRGDHGQIEQVLMNLLVNARDALVAGGTITVGIETRSLAEGEVESCAAGTYVVLEVSDDGVGIDPTILHRVFEPYFTTKTWGPIKGTGLGLSTVLGIVRSHDGFIEACPRSPRGTTMRIAFPTLEHRATIAAAPTTSQRLARGSGQLVLVVDDEPMVRAATARTIMSIGYRVVEAEDGAHALDVFAEHASDVAAVVLDMVMPGLSALEVYEGLCARRADVPVVVVTGAAVSEDLDALLARGVRSALAKPFEVAQLAELLAAMTSRRA